MTCFICVACGTQYSESEAPPSACRVCTDDRQYVPWSGQSWTTLAELTEGHSVRFEADGGLMGIGVTPSFAIPQRALLVPTQVGNVMWDCTSVVTDDAIDTIAAQGGVVAIAISHPHFYSSMVEWSDALGGVPIFVHADDREWIARPSPHITPWSGDCYELAPDASLIHTPGHFPGSCVLHWTGAPDGKRVLLVGDSLHVATDRRGVTFVHSVPNHIPMHPDCVTDIRARLADIHFDDVYGFTWGLNLLGDACARVDASFDRYLTAVGRAG